MEQRKFSSWNNENMLFFEGNNRLTKQFSRGDNETMNTLFDYCSSPPHFNPCKPRLCSSPPPPPLPHGNPCKPRLSAHGLTANPWRSLNLFWIVLCVKSITECEDLLLVLSPFCNYKNAWLKCMRIPSYTAQLIKRKLNASLPPKAKIQFIASLDILDFFL